MRSRPSLRIRFKWANLISIFLRSRHDCSKVLEIDKERANGIPNQIADRLCISHVILLPFD